MKQIIVAVALLLASLSSRSHADNVVVYVYNTEFSVNLPGEPVEDAVITAGDTVQWVWVQGNHTTTAVSGSPEQWNAPINSSNTQFSRVFSQPGVYWYYCIPHGFDNGDGTAGGMAGTITVLPPGPGACCMPGGAGCMVTSPAECARMGGTYLGDGSACDPDPCGTDPITLEVVAAADNVLYETVDGSTSNALGRYLYAGNRTTGARRRPVLRFDLSAIPSGAVIQTASLRVFCNDSAGGAYDIAAHRLVAAWGEGTSMAGGNEGSGAPATPGDPTWLHTFYPSQFWATPGGDFTGTASGSTTFAASGVVYDISGPGMVADVQHWVSMPAMNHGWILRGDELTSNNTKRLDSRESATEANRPRLIVTYLPRGLTGACCMPDGSCAELTEKDCAAMGGTFRGIGVFCHDVSCPVQLEPFVDALRRPAIAQPLVGQPGGAAHYEISMTEQFQFMHRDLPLTRTWGYDGSYPGPTIEARRGEPVTVVWKNNLRVPETGALRTTHVLPVDECLHGPDITGQTPVAIVHLHGGKVPPDSDGYPEDAFPPGQQSPVYTYPNDQPASTIWYHDHALGITRLNVTMGMAGFYLIRDDAEDALGLPAGEYEIPLAIQDRSFNADGTIRYPEMWHEHFFGDVIVVNGKVWPYLNVDQGKYRFRMVNGSTSRTYTLSLSDGAYFWQIGTDLGLLEVPVPLTELTIMPGERADVVMDFAAYAPGTEVVLTNSAPAPFPGFPGVGVIPNVMKFIVQARAGHTTPLPATLTSIPFIDASEADLERVLELRQVPNTHCPDHHEAMWTIDGMMWDEITEFPVLGSTEIWTWKNPSGISHPMHMHLVMAQVLNRQEIDPETGEPTGPLLPPAANERGWKDTVQCPPGMYTRVITRFEGFPGLYPYHCHIIEHEDHEMMRQFEAVCPPTSVEVDPVSGVVCRGSSIVLASTVTGYGEFSRAWEHREAIEDPWTPVVDGAGQGLGEVSGSATGTLTIEAPTAQAAGEYRLVAAGVCAPGDGVASEPVGVAYYCDADWSCDGVVNAADVGAFLSAYFADIGGGSLDTDVDGNGVVNAADVGQYLTGYFSSLGPCP